MAKKALITGIAGQDGSYLAELLLQKGYEVHGIARPENEGMLERTNIANVRNTLVLHEGNIADGAFIDSVVREVLPDEIYHLATIHEVVSTPEGYRASREIHVDSTFHFLHSITQHVPTCKLFYASSGKIFGKPRTAPQNEKTVVDPDSLYSITKVTGMDLVKLFRAAHSVFACSGILYNHESPRRDVFFLPRKITHAAVELKKGRAKELRLGDLDAVRDWGFAGDYVEAMWRMLQAEKPSDYVIGTGVPHTVRDILDIAFREVGLEWKRYVVADPTLVRREEPVPLVADITKIHEELGWQPTMAFEELIAHMVREEH